MKLKLICSLCAATLAALSMNSCANMAVSSAGQEADGSDGLLVLPTPSNNSERIVASYLERSNVVNLICEDYMARTLSEGAAIKYLTEYIAVMEKDSPEIMCDSTLWSILNGPKYGPSYEALKARAFANVDKLGVYLEPDYHDRNSKLQGLLGMACCLATHSG